MQIRSRLAAQDASYLSPLPRSDSVSTHTMILRDTSWLACHQLIVVKEMRNASNQPPPPPVTSKLQILTYFYSVPG